MAISTLPYFDPKAPEDIAPFTRDFTNLLSPESADGSIPADTITGTPTITITGTDNALTAATATVDGPFVTTVLSGGTAGVVYTVSYTINTMLGITVTRSALVQVMIR